MRNKILEKLLPLTETVDFILSEDLSTLTPVIKTREKKETIHHEEVLASPEFWSREVTTTSDVEPVLEDGSVDTSFVYVPEVIVDDVVTSSAYWKKTETIILNEEPTLEPEAFTYHKAVEYVAPYSEEVVVTEIIHHEEVPAILDENGDVVTPAVPAYDETVTVMENYTETLPDFEKLKFSLIDDIGTAINRWLIGKENLKTNDDGICFRPDGFDWFFKNIERPKSEELYFALEETKKEAKQTELYNTMNNDVLDQMKAVFGTTNPDSATANEGTWRLMISKPNIFIGKLGFTNEADVVAFGQNKINEVEAYAVWRMERIEQFRKDREAL